MRERLESLARKIPRAVLHRCEWGRDDYSLAVAQLPAPPAANANDEVAPAPATRSSPNGKKRGRKAPPHEPELFEEVEP